MISITTNIDRDMLLTMINDHIKENKIVTWSVDGEGDYTTVQPQWRYRAWMRPVKDENNEHKLYFVIVKSKKFPMTKSLYGVFHGRFAEMLLTHFDTQITSLEISSMLVPQMDLF